MHRSKLGDFKEEIIQQFHVINVSLERIGDIEASRRANLKANNSLSNLH
jgi:hypothetical protein